MTSSASPETITFETKKAKYRNQLKLQEQVLQLKVAKYEQTNPAHPSVIITLKKVAVLQRECGEIEQSKRNLQMIINTITKSFKSATTSSASDAMVGNINSDGNPHENSISRIRQIQNNDKTCINLLIDQAWAYNELGTTYLRSDNEEEKENLSVEYFEKALVCIQTANEKLLDIKSIEEDDNSSAAVGAKLNNEITGKRNEEKAESQDIDIKSESTGIDKIQEEKEFYVNINFYLEVAHSNLALCYLSNNQVHEAEPILQKLLEIQNRARTLTEFTAIKNVKGYDIITTMDLLAYTNVLLRRFTVAHELYEEALNIGKVYYPIGSIQIGERYEQIALCYFMEGKNKEAEKFFRLAHDSYVKSKVFSVPEITSGGVAGEHFFGRQSKYNTSVTFEDGKQDKRKSPKGQKKKKKSPKKTSPQNKILDIGHSGQKGKTASKSMPESNENMQSKQTMNAIARCINNIAVCICRHNNKEIPLSKHAKRSCRTVYF